ncbi:hypothetical protein BHE74_00047196, partial [Ensete ventricosum]
MSEPEEYCCFIGSLSWSTTDRGLKDAFQKFGHLVEAKVTFSVGTEMGEAVGVMEVIVIIVNALVHMNALVEAVVAIDLDPVAASV